MRDKTKLHPRLQKKIEEYTVYIHKVTKEISGHCRDKVYIGITRQNLQDRWKRGLGYSKNTLMGRAIRKYGWDNIEHKVLLTGLTVEKAAIIERELIKRYNSTDPDYGYNLTSGGDNILSGVQVSESTRKKHSDLQKEKWLDPDFRKRMSGKNCHLHHDKYVFYGKDNVTSKKTVLLNTMEVFDCQREAGAKYGVGYSAVNKCCTGKARYGGKNKSLGFLVWMDYDEYVTLSDAEIEKRLKDVKRIYSNRAKKVLDTKKQRIYPTATFLAKELERGLATVTECVKECIPIDGTTYTYLNDFCEKNQIDQDFLMQICEEVDAI